MRAQWDPNHNHIHMIVLAKGKKNYPYQYLALRQWPVRP